MGIAPPKERTRMKRAVAVRDGRRALSGM